MVILLMRFHGAGKAAIEPNDIGALRLDPNPAKEVALATLTRGWRYVEDRRCNATEELISNEGKYVVSAIKID